MKASVLNALLELFKDSYGFSKLEVQFNQEFDRAFWRVHGNLYGTDYYYDTNGNKVHSKYFYGDGETIEEAFKNLEAKLVRILGLRQ
jgi:hypothetical protein